MKKIAFLFLTKQDHNCELLWNIFFKDIPKNMYNIYNHYKVIPNQEFLKNNAIKEITQTRWGDISLVYATILLYKQAILDDQDNYFFILLSESCVPLCNFKTLQKTLFTINCSMIHYKHLANKLNRYQMLHPYIKKSLSFNEFYSQHQWMILTKPIVNLILNNNMLYYFQKVPAVDEHYFISVLTLLKKNKEILNHKITFCNWSNKLSMHPKMYEKLDNSLIKVSLKNNFFFLRKISSNFNPTLFHKKLVFSFLKK